MLPVIIAGFFLVSIVFTAVVVDTYYETLENAAECIRHQEWCAAEQPELYEILLEGGQK